VRRVVIGDARIARNATPAAFDRALRGERLLEPARHGKWMLAHTSGPTLAIHFGITGDLEWAPGSEGRHRHDRAILLTDRGEMRYRNMRLWGGLWLAHDDRDLAAIIGPLGPDALAVPPRELEALLARRRGMTKAALMDQRLFAGVGNLVADEVLWQARIHPHRRLDDLGEDERTRLARTVHAVLTEAVARDDYLERKRSWLSHVRGRPDAACPRCGTPLARTVAAGRTTWFCPACQPPPQSPGRAGRV